MRAFKAKVLKLVALIPKGQVASYGQIAAAVGNPRAGRQVGWVLRGRDVLQKSIPWWRVVNNKGEISIKGNPTATKLEQKILLEKEGVTVNSEFILEMRKYRTKNF